MDSLTIYNFEPLVDDPKENKKIRSAWLNDLQENKKQVKTFQWATEHFGKDPLGHVSEDVSGRSTPSSSSDSGFSEEEEASSATDRMPSTNCRSAVSPIVFQQFPQRQWLQNQPTISAPSSKVSAPSTSRPIPHLAPDLPPIPNEEDMVQMAIAAEDPAFWKAYYEGMEFYPKWYGKFNVHF